MKLHTRGHGVLGVALMTAIMSCSAHPTPGQIIFPQNGAVIRSPLHAESSGAGQWKLDGQPMGGGTTLNVPVEPGAHELSYGSSRLSFSVRDEISGSIVPVTTPMTATTPQLFSVLAGDLSVPLNGVKPPNTTGQQALIRLQPPEAQLSRRLTDAVERGARPAQPRLHTQALSEHRTFQMNNLQGGLNTVQADLLNDSGDMAIWIDAQATDAQRASALQTGLTFERERRQIVEAYFGTPSDVDGDGRVHLLFSPLLNTSGIAVGFFDPSDLLDPAMSGNNGMELLYLGLPEDNFNYSPPSLLATACHEYQHLVNFGRKSLPPLYSGQLITETLAVNEGLSHLAEDLCGLNVSGGNVAFVAAALDANGEGSFSGADIHGQTDTPARRGLAYLHLRRMLNEQRDPQAFLRRVVNARQTGWSNVSAQAETIRPSQADLQRTVWAMQLAGTPEAPAWANFSGVSGPGPDAPGVNPRQGWIPVWNNLGVNLHGLNTLTSWPQRLPAGGFALREHQGAFNPPAGAVTQRRIP